jgi:ATP-dependent RNA helicase DDX19/DBP5
MSREERDEYVDKFRKGEVNTIITTDLLARGFDMQSIKLVINFDMPLTKDGKGNKVADYENY